MLRNPDEVVVHGKIPRNSIPAPMHFGCMAGLGFTPVPGRSRPALAPDDMSPWAKIHHRFWFSELRFLGSHLSSGVGDSDGTREPTEMSERRAIIEDSES